MNQFILRNTTRDKVQNLATMTIEGLETNKAIKGISFVDIKTAMLSEELMISKKDIEFDAKQNLFTNTLSNVSYILLTEEELLVKAFVDMFYSIIRLKRCFNKQELSVGLGIEEASVENVFKSLESSPHVDSTELIDYLRDSKTNLGYFILNIVESTNIIESNYAWRKLGGFVMYKL